MSRILLFSFFLLASCCKEDSESISVAEQIKEVIESRKIVRVIAAQSYSEFFNLVADSQNGLVFKIEHDFIHFGTVSWNLNQLKTFVIQDFGNGKLTLGLIF